MKIVVITAEKLEANRLEDIKSILAKKITKTKLDVQTVIDESLIGGIQIMIGSQLYDGSVRAKLSQIKAKTYKLI